MCGIIGIVSRPPTREAPVPAELVALLDQAVAASSIVEATELVDRVDASLKEIGRAHV